MNTGPHARWFRARLAVAGIIDIGAGEHAGRVWRSRRMRRAHGYALAAGVVLALGCATAGVVPSILPTGGSVAMTATTYRIGDATLHAVAPGVYAGSETLVLGHSGPELAAGGSAGVDGARWVGFCDVAADGAAETCRRSLSAVAWRALPSPSAEQVLMLQTLGLSAPWFSPTRRAHRFRAGSVSDRVRAASHM